MIAKSIIDGRSPEAAYACVLAAKTKEVVNDGLLCLGQSASNDHPYMTGPPLAQHPESAYTARLLWCCVDPLPEYDISMRGSSGVGHRSRYSDEFLRLYVNSLPAELSYQNAHVDRCTKRFLHAPFRAVEFAYFASAALIIYEYCITFHREVNQIWRRGFSSSTLLFYAVRYPAVINPLFVLLDLVPWNGQSDRTCAILVRSEMALNVLLLCSAAVFSSLRAYALCAQNITILVVVLGLGLMNPVISIYTFVESTPFLITAPLQACGFYTTIAPSTYEKCHSARRDMETDLVNTCRGIKLCAHVQSDPDSHARWVLLIVNLIGLALIRRIDLVEPMSTWIAISPLTLTSRFALRFTSILTSRFIIDLHEASNGYSGGDTRFTHFASLSMPVFRQPTTAGRSVYGTILTERTAGEDFDESEIASLDGKDVNGMMVAMGPVQHSGEDDMLNSEEVRQQ
ncbi:hypothetical protein L226DRAFT_522734 [Lentinus tigrinus ALCF2SS1-7]|uniref:uncharacterized protein n=1 Tax=Lentinus tigrinus ALCF2SS1-7 TaxID=1328758 RepID=UPI001165EE18|nr:hypothetical protein L226DRAFT_522734 [Lentinus tigrinus ALCF2SS1-7]